MIILFVCIECGRTFEEPVYWTERHGLDAPPYERLSGCPHCQGSYTEAYECDCCNEWITTETYVKTEDGKRYCEDCFCLFNLGDE